MIYKNHRCNLSIWGWKDKSGTVSDKIDKIYENYPRNNRSDNLKDRRIKTNSNHLDNLDMSNLMCS